VSRLCCNVRCHIARLRIASAMSSDVRLSSDISRWLDAVASHTTTVLPADNVDAHSDNHNHIDTHAATKKRPRSEDIDSGIGVSPNDSDEPTTPTPRPPKRQRNANEPHFSACLQYEESAYSQRPQPYVALRACPRLCAPYTCMKGWLRSGKPNRSHRVARDSTSNTSLPIPLIATRLKMRWSMSTSRLPLYQQSSAGREGIAP
jgi:hypothetical protein